MSQLELISANDATLTRRSRRPRQTRTCQHCGEQFSVKASDIDKGGGKYCTRVCRLAAGWSGKPCASDGCDAEAHCRGLCKRCYGNWRTANSSSEMRQKRSEYARQYYLVNREKILAREFRYREEGGVARRRHKATKVRVWRQANPERYRENHRRYFAKKKYGLTLEEYDAILARGCAICGTDTGSVTRSGEGMPTNAPRLCLDHDHSNGKVRDALCHSCNTGLGSFGDSPERLRAAADYLERHGS